MRLLQRSFEKIKFNLTGANYKTVHQYVKSFNLDTSHWTGQAHNKGKKNYSTKRIPLKEILKKESTYSNNSNLKRRLIEEGFIEEKCKECGIDPVWKGKKLVLILDHIDGDNTNNERINLRLLCPNCNSQQSTFAGRNKKRKNYENYCCNCKRPIHFASKRCTKCAALARHGLR